MRSMFELLITLAGLEKAGVLTKHDDAGKGAITGAMTSMVNKAAHREELHPLTSPKWEAANKALVLATPNGSSSRVLAAPFCGVLVPAVKRLVLVPAVTRLVEKALFAPTGSA
ncbi:hypothetical protein T484DRAFT_1780063 [Baffinella frigidus]|nr:hypothetical protein T484DRAFT_1780063 [Cryptophyta sp. CCMP2293]